MNNTILISSCFGRLERFLHTNRLKQQWAHPLIISPPLTVSNLRTPSGGANTVPDISTNHLWDFSGPPLWLMLQQCSFGTERLPCRLPSDSLRNSLRKHVLPNFSSRALISLAGQETKSKIRTNSSIVGAFGPLGRVDHDAVGAPSSGGDYLARQIKTHQRATVAESWERQDKLALHNIKNKSFHQLLLSPRWWKVPSHIKHFWSVTTKQSFCCL